MALNEDPLYIPKLLDEVDPIPALTVVTPDWLLLTFDPVTRTTYKTTARDFLNTQAPTTAFGLTPPVFPSSEPVNSLYYETPANGGFSLWQLGTTAWSLRYQFAGGGAPAQALYTATKGYTATCASGFTGNPQYRQTTRTSTVSQADADALALAAATAAAMSALVCTVAAQTFTATQSFTATCPSGSVGSAVTQSYTATSTISQSDANLQALAEARRLARQALVCTVVAVTPPAPFFTAYNVAGRTASVAAPSGYSVADLDYVVNGGPALSVPVNGQVPVGPQAVLAGNLVVYVRGTATRNQGAPAASTTSFPVAGGTAVMFTATQTYTASCPSGSTGTPVTRTSTRTSAISQEDATTLAQLTARASAEAALVCTVAPAPTFANAAQSYTTTAQDYAEKCGSGTGTPVTQTVAAGTVSSTVSVAAANATALAQATTAAKNALVCVVEPPAFAPTLTGPSATEASGVTLTTNGSADEVEYAVLGAVANTDAKTMYFTVAGTIVTSLDYPASYEGQAIRYRRASTGVVTSFTFTNDAQNPV